MLARDGITVEDNTGEVDNGAAIAGVELGTGRGGEYGTAYNVTELHADPRLKVNLGVNTAKTPLQSVVEVS
jgi:hypothetical protein